MADVDNIYDSDAEMRRLYDILAPRYVAMLMAVHNTLQSHVPNQNILQFRVTNPDVVQLLTEAAQQVVGINETTREAIREQLVIGEANGLSTWEIANGRADLDYPGIQGVFGQTWANRPEMIARTELQHAQNEATLNRYHAANVEYVRIIDGDEWDRPCADRNGTIVPVTARPQLNHPNCTLMLEPVLPEEIT
jgi:hypothetical protein